MSEKNTKLYDINISYLFINIYNIYTMHMYAILCIKICLLHILQGSVLSLIKHQKKSDILISTEVQAALRTSHYHILHKLMYFIDS